MVALQRWAVQRAGFLFALLASFYAVPLIAAPVASGAEVFFSGDLKVLAGKRVGMLSHQAAHYRDGMASWQSLVLRAKSYNVTALFGPEHGFFGQAGGGNAIVNETIAATDTIKQLKVYSLYGKQRKPTPQMLAEIDILVVDLQDVGLRNYTYISTLFYAMEAAAAAKIPIIVLDRPNPISGEIVDGTSLDPAWRSFVGYIDVPFCHGMTIGELAHFFNDHYRVGCSLKVIPMRGYRRAMTFEQTGLTWLPTSPQIPEATTPLYYATTGLLGELGMINHGVGYTAPFKLIGAPWIDSDHLQRYLSQLKLPGAQFHPFRFTPYFGKYQGVACSGVYLHLRPNAKMGPVTLQLHLFGALKALYPVEFERACAALKDRRDTFCRFSGTKDLLDALTEPGQSALLRLHKRVDRDRRAFLKAREPYLIKAYAN